MLGPVLAPGRHAKPDTIPEQLDEAVIAGKSALSVHLLYS